jgi:hypothetical protein
MAFRDQLLRKIEIDRLAQKVLSSFGPPGSEAKPDKDAMRELLELSSYSHRRERDLDLYVEGSEAPLKTIIVLDNELPAYRTTVEDVAMRKSPFVGEMVKIRNIIKILKDSDVKISRKEETVKAVQSECIARLDLNYTASDIDDIRRDGIASLESGYAEGVQENLMLFAELLGYRSPPKAFQVPHVILYGAVELKPNGEHVLGPVAAFSLVGNLLQLTHETFGSLDKNKMERFKLIAAGKETSEITGSAVFEALQKAVPEAGAAGGLRGVSP